MGRQRDVTIILGQTGGGKTQKALELTRDLSRVLVLDADFQEFPAIHYDDLGIMALDLERRGVEKSAVPFRASYTPMEDEYELCIEMARELENVTLVLEEADRFSWAALPEYRRAVTRGRHWGVSLMALAPAATLIPLHVRRQARRIIVFRQLNPDDVKELSAQVGQRAYEFGPDESGRYTHPEFYYLDWNSRDGARIFNGRGVQVSSAENNSLTNPSSSAITPALPARVPESPGGDSVSGDPGGEIDSESQGE